MEKDEISGNDPCHYNVSGLSDKDAKVFFKIHHERNLFLCDGINDISKKLEEIQKLYDQNLIA